MFIFEGLDMKVMLILRIFFFWKKKFKGFIIGVLLFLYVKVVCIFYFYFFCVRGILLLKFYL